MDFNGRSVVLTGVGGEGQVGAAVATAFAEAGARVFLVGRRQEEVNARAERLTASGRRAAGLSADLADAASVASLAERIREATAGRVHALVHLAGGFAMSGPVAESDPATWFEQHSRNATTAYLCARAFLPLLRATKGSVVFFASTSALAGGRAAGMSAYVAAKSAVIALMQAIALEESKHGVRANAIAPTAVRTTSNEQSMGPDVSYVSREDVSRIALWLCSDAARVVTGQVISLR